MDKTNALSLTGGGMFDGGWTPVWLIKDEFTDTVAAGSVNSTAATPGPGTRNVDVDANAQIGSGALSNVGSAQLFSASSSTFARAAGLAAYWKHTGTERHLVCGLSVEAHTTGYVSSHALYFGNNQLIRYPYAALVEDVSPNVEYKVFIVVRTSGAFYFVRGDAFASWTVVWVDSTITSTPLYAMNRFLALGTVSNLDAFRVTSLPAPFDTDDGLATDTHSGSVASGTTFVHEADMLLEITVATLTTTNMSFSFRQASDTNRWFAYIVNNGDFYLFETVDGVSTQRAFAAGAIASGDRVVIVAEGSTIRGYSKNVLRWTYASATSHAAATTGKIMSVGNGGVFSDVKTWPRTLSGTAAGILNKASA